jgi:uncharacterized protein (DUF2252 family)
MTAMTAARTARPARPAGLDSGPGRLTPSERAARGQEARARAPLDSHAAFGRPPGLPDPLTLLRQQAASRLPGLVPVRYGRMMVSPFAYFRGAALPMASDLAATPVSGLTVQAWEWDLKRLAASLEIAARDNGFSRKKRQGIVLSTVAGYRQAMRDFAGMSNLDVWYASAGIDRLRAEFGPALSGKQLQRVNTGLAQARTRDSMQAVSKLTRTVDGRPRIISEPPLLVPVDELITQRARRQSYVAEVSGLLASYRRTLATDRRHLLDQFEFADMARKVVGVGSVGTRCWIVLMLGRDTGDPLFLQVKEAEQSVLSRFAGSSRYANQGQRVVAGQRLMQASSDIFLGWQHIDAGLDNRPRDFYVRQLRDWKFSPDIAALIPRGMRMYGQLCGWTLARAHARSGDRIAIAAYLGSSDTFDRAVASFATAYADQNERDHQALLAAVASGRIAAEQGL